MIRWLQCGCKVDDDKVTTTHVPVENDDDLRSDGDVRTNRHHYPIGSRASTLCLYCDLNRPCLCDKIKDTAA